jgi:hypothetical protein
MPATGSAADGVAGVVYLGDATWLVMRELRNPHGYKDWSDGRDKKIVPGIRTAFTPRTTQTSSFA